MDCVHCGHPLPGSWCLSQEKPSPELRVGSLVVAKKGSGVCDPGEQGVVYKQYELGNRPGWSVIFQSGRHDGFSPCDVDFFFDVTGEVCEELTGYTFENVGRLADDFDRGDFAPALEGQIACRFLGDGFSSSDRRQGYYLRFGSRLCLPPELRNKAEG